MDPAPQGAVLVRSPPRGAGRRGRDDPKHAGGYDWDQIVDYARQVIATKWWLHCPHVPHGSVANLRERYPDCTFHTHAVHLRQSDQKERPTKVCDVYVRAGEDDQASTD
jgi:hypothetical protein